MAGVPSSALALIVEDDPQIARLLREILTMQGHEVVEVEDGALAAPTVRALRPDVVLLDLGLPNVHGLDVLADLKGNPDTVHIPVVVVTAWWTADLSGRARAMGATAVIAKPFDVAEVCEAVRAVLTGEPVPLPTAESEVTR